MCVEGQPCLAQRHGFLESNHEAVPRNIDPNWILIAEFKI